MAEDFTRFQRNGVFRMAYCAENHVYMAFRVFVLPIHTLRPGSLSGRCFLCFTKLQINRTERKEQNEKDNRTDPQRPAYRSPVYRLRQQQDRELRR